MQTHDSSAPRLLDQVRDRIRRKHYSIRTEQAYLHWVKAYVRFHGMKHPAKMGAPEVESFLTYLLVERHVSSSTQNQALSGLLFLYREVLEIDCGVSVKMFSSEITLMPILRIGCEGRDISREIVTG